MEAEQLVGCTLALVITYFEEHNATDTVVFVGKVVSVGSKFASTESEAETTFEVPNQWLPRINLIVDAEARETLLEADAWIALSCSELPPGTDRSQTRDTGLPWPREFDR